MKVFILVFSIAWVLSSSAAFVYKSGEERCSLYIALEKQRKDNEFTDVVFRTSDGRNTTAHRVVLAAESPALKRLLEEAAERGHPDEDIEMVADQPAAYEEEDSEDETIVRRTISKVVKTVRTKISSYDPSSDDIDLADIAQQLQKTGQQQKKPQKPPTTQQQRPAQRQPGDGQRQQKPDLGLKEQQLGKVVKVEMVRPPKGQYCDCYKLTVEVPHDCDAMDSVLDYLYTGETNITDVDAAIEALLEYQLDKPADELAEEHMEELKPETVKKVMKSVKETLKTYKDNRVVDTILKKVKKRKDVDKLAKELPPKTFIEYLDEKEMTNEFAVETISNWLETADATDTVVKPNELEAILDNIDLEKLNCTELAKFTETLSHSRYDPRKVLQKIMDMSMRGTGRCHSACGECLREYLHHMKFHYEPRVWNISQQMKPQSIAGLETTLGSFFIGTDEFTATLQRDSSPTSQDSCVDGLVLYKHGLKGVKGKVQSSEFDMELIIDPKGEGTKDCPLRNRLRYRFDDRTNMYKWNTKFDYNQPQDIVIKMNPVSK